MLLALETSTKSCSVALVHQKQVLAQRHVVSEGYVHSEKLHLFIQAVLKEAGVKPTELEAVAVGKGPGSYTGLRIGVSAAKGLCYALNIPLLSATGPQTLMQRAPFLASADVATHLFIPMIDARRQEVYQAVYTNGREIEPIEAAIIDQNSFDKYLENYPKIHLFGDGADKFSTLFKDHTQIMVHPEVNLNAADLASVANEKLANHHTEDVAYFEPFYLKDFVALKPKNPFF